MIRLLVADDHPIIREGLKQIVAETADIVVAGEAGSGDEVLDKARSGDLNVLLLDISMPGRSWLSTIEELSRQRPGLAILVLSRHPEEQYALHALKAGAAGYLTKTNVADELVRAIRRVAAGRKYISPALAEKLALDSASGANVGKLPHETLSPREFRVMCLLASGKAIKEIAYELSVNQTTVSTHRARLMRKMQMKSNADLVRYALQHHLVD